MNTTTIVPKESTITGMVDIPVPVSYTGSNGLLQSIASEAVSSTKVVPKVRAISVEQFTSGQYPFPVPATYTPAPYTLPMIEPIAWEVDAEQVNAYVPIQIYKLGSSEQDNMFFDDFPIVLGQYTYGDSSSSFQLNQTVRLIIWKEQGVDILWAQSNISNNGMPSASIKASQLLVLDIVNLGGELRVSNWLLPNFLMSGMDGLDSATLAEILTKINDRTTTAGGDLEGDYPNPTIKKNAVTTTKINNSAITEPKLADETVSSRTIVDKAVEEGKIADGAISTRSIKDDAITLQKIAPIEKNTILGNNGSSESNPKSLSASAVRALLGISPNFDFTNPNVVAIEGLSWGGRQVYGVGWQAQISETPITKTIANAGEKLSIIDVVGSIDDSSTSASSPWPGFYLTLVNDKFYYGQQCNISYFNDGSIQITTNGIHNNPTYVSLYILFYKQ